MSSRRATRGKPVRQHVLRLCCSCKLLAITFAIIFATLLLQLHCYLQLYLQEQQIIFAAHMAKILQHQGPHPAAQRPNAEYSFSSALAWKQEYLNI